MRIYQNIKDNNWHPFYFMIQTDEGLCGWFIEESEVTYDCYIDEKQDVLIWSDE